MPQFFIDSSSIKNGVATVTGDDARHITKVLRLAAGDWIVLSDGFGRSWRGTIILAGTKEVKIDVKELPPSGNNSTTIRLCQAIVKHDKFEWVIQKAVELGCNEIIPFTSDRTIPKFHDGKIIRWQKIAHEAAKQCGTRFMPKVLAPVAFPKLISSVCDPKDKSVLFFEGEDKLPITEVDISGSPVVNIIIGPEGGFSKEEAELAKSSGVITSGLGPLILRVETAAIAALTVIQYKLGYFAGVAGFSPR